MNVNWTAWYGIVRFDKRIDSHYPILTFTTAPIPTRTHTYKFVLISMWVLFSLFSSMESVKQGRMLVFVIDFLLASVIFSSGEIEMAKSVKNLP